jgi:uncharacterized protein
VPRRNKRLSASVSEALQEAPCWLLDGNLLVALSLPSHTSHSIALDWFNAAGGCFATCAITQGTLLRLHLLTNPKPSVAEAWRCLRAIASHPDHVFWEDGFSYLEVNPARLTGHRQITDAWLAELARRHRSRVATLDTGFASAHPDCVTLVHA